MPEQTSKWNFFIVLIDLIAIGLYTTFHLLDIHYTIAGIGIDLLSIYIVIALGGIPLVFEIFKQVFKGNFGTDLLAAIALITAVLLESYLAAAGVILRRSGGQALEVYATQKASSVLLALAERMPTIAHLKKGANILDIKTMDIKIGDLIVIYPHEVSPVDGIVVSGHGSMDEAYLTGEPYKISKAPGAAVISGAVNGDNAIIIQADKLPSDSRYAKIMEVMQNAEEKRPKLRRIGDQLGAVFTPVALVIAAGAWIYTGDAIRFLSVLVIATPCPLLIAIPVTIISAISIAAKNGIIIKDPAVLERIPTCKTAIFDKTGTLTYGKPTFTEISVADGINPDEILSYVASLERYSKHPLSSAIIKEAKKRKLFVPQATEISELPGSGLKGKVLDSDLQITHRQKVSKEIQDILPEQGSGLECVILKDGKYAALFKFHDEMRKDSKVFVSHLGPSHQFNKIMLVSGDRESEVLYLAGKLGIKDTLSSQTPEQKLMIVEEENKKAPTLFMGDGINDAPAMRAATVAIAFGHESNVTSEAAGAVIMENSLVKVDELIHLSINMRKIVMQSAVGGMLLSVLGMGFAAAGFISPVSGALLQELIDVIAITNALRLIWEKKVKIDI
jgi:heavy metal translocating P-type ATPase